MGDSALPATIVAALLIVRLCQIAQQKGLLFSGHPRAAAGERRGTPPLGGADRRTVNRYADGSTE